MKKALIYGVAATISSAFGFLTLIYLANHISSEELGFIGLTLALLFITEPLAGWQAYNLVGISSATHSKLQYLVFKSRFFNFCFFNLIILGLISIFAYLLFDQYSWVIFYAYLITIVRTIQRVHYIEFNQLSHVYRYISMQVTIAVSGFIMTVLTFKYFEPSWHIRMAVLIGCELIFTLTFIKYDFGIRINRLSNLDKHKPFYKFGNPLIPALLASWVLMQADRYIVLHFFSISTVGLYLVVYNIGRIMEIVNRVNLLTIRPNVYQKLNQNNNPRIIYKYSINYALFSFAIFLISSILIYNYAKIIFPAEYAKETEITLIVVCFFCFLGLWQVLNLPLEFLKENKIIARALFYSALVNLTISISLIPIFDYKAPAYGTLCSGIFLAIYTAYKVHNVKVVQSI